MSNPDKFVTKRHRLDPINEPLYSFSDVPRARRGMKDSVVLEIKQRHKWISLLGEVLLLCNEAANRRKASQYVPPGHRGKPLSLEYIADRFDLDDPLRGYCVRSKIEGWLQGFVTVTDFTTWQSYFRWDSMRRESEITDNSIDYLHEHDDETETRTWMKERVRDLDGKIAWELSQQVHDGDYEREGVVWPRVAEISLLAGIGCGSWMLQLIIDQLESPDSKYQWLVLQASENAVTFYERFGFVRVGAVARYDAAKKDEDPNTSDDDDDDDDSDDDSDDDDSGSKKKSKGKNKKNNNKKNNSNQIDPRDERLHRRQQLQATMAAEKAGTTKRPKRQRAIPSAPPDMTGLCSDFHWYQARDDETPTFIAKKFNIDVHDLLFLNARVMGGLSPSVKLYGGTYLRIPKAPTPYDPDVVAQHALEHLSKGENGELGGTPGALPTSNQPYYFALNDETPNDIAIKLGCDATELVKVNKPKFKGLFNKSKLLENTKLLIPGRELNAKQKKEEKLPPIVPYRHWTFQDDKVEFTPPSFMMARRLIKRKKSHHVTTTHYYKTAADMSAAKKSAISETSVLSSSSSSSSSPPITSSFSSSSSSSATASTASTSSTSSTSFSPSSSSLSPLGRTPAQVILDDRKVSFAPDVSRIRGVTADGSTEEDNEINLLEDDWEANEIAMRIEEEEKLNSEQIIPIRVRFVGKKLATTLKLDVQFPDNFDWKVSPPPSPLFGPGEDPDEDENVDSMELDEDEEEEEEEQEQEQEQDDAKKTQPMKVVPSSSSFSSSSTSSSVTSSFSSTFTSSSSSSSASTDTMSKKRPRPSQNVTLYLHNCPYMPFRDALISKPLRPTLPIKPKGRTSCYMFFNNVQRSEMRIKYPNLRLCDTSKLVAEKWHKMSDKKKEPYNKKSNRDKNRYDKEMKVFHQERSDFEATMAKLYPDEPIPWHKEAKKKKKRKVGRSKGYSNLVNKVVRVEFVNQRSEPGWEYYFVLTYIPDLQWCRLAPMRAEGAFTTERHGISNGRFRWKLVEEGKALEVDVSAQRCTVVKTRVMKHTPNADEEEWDILDDAYYSACDKFDLSGNVYKSVAKTLMAPLLSKFKNVTVNSSPNAGKSEVEVEEEEEEEEEEDTSSKGRKRKKSPKAKVPRKLKNKKVKVKKK